MDLAMTDYPVLALFINGRWRGGEGRASEPVLNPSTGGVLGALPHASADDLDEAPPRRRAVSNCGARCRQSIAGPSCSAPPR